MDEFLTEGEEFFLYADEGVTIFRDWDGDGFVDEALAVSGGEVVESFELTDGWAGGFARSPGVGVEYEWGWEPTPIIAPEMGDSGIHHSYIPAAWRNQGDLPETLADELPLESRSLERNLEKEPNTSPHLSGDAE